MELHEHIGTLVLTLNEEILAADASRKKVVKLIDKVSKAPLDVKLWSKLAAAQSTTDVLQCQAKHVTPQTNIFTS